MPVRDYSKWLEFSDFLFALSIINFLSLQFVNVPRYLGVLLVEGFQNLDYLTDSWLSLNPKLKGLNRECGCIYFKVINWLIGYIKVAQSVLEFKNSRILY